MTNFKISPNILIRVSIKTLEIYRSVSLLLLLYYLRIVLVSLYGGSEQRAVRCVDTIFRYQ